MDSLVTASLRILDAIHDLGIIHNSLHHGNVLIGPGDGVTRHRKVWFIDFQRAGKRCLAVHLSLTVKSIMIPTSCCA
jgi:Ser/Thr protein kinase RdoA (MazF antagonist)